ncbi:hypothetical protein LAZ67_1007957 [Cordylochernes scorpioides]|uniref:Transposase n=1 Tax=Cordylochernes scorpioides TaxID=51811 RepID=A0ABY6K1F0_9ARAC|nr:hypothetical protein LAZ67_1007957 [Cordylochernes scorpioides]
MAPDTCKGPTPPHLFKAGRISIEDDPRQERPKCAKNHRFDKRKSSNHFAVELEQGTGISKTTIGRIVTKDLKLKKTPAKFIPRFLTNEQKLCRLATCENMLEMTRTDPEWKDKIITGDETWVYDYDPETKRQYAEWRGQARMIALDGLPFSVFVISKDLRKCLNALGHEIPLSAETIKIKVCRYADTFRENVVRELQMEKEKGKHFNLALDEWTSIRSKRYLNINIHSRTKVWNLGLTRISGVFSSEQCKYVIGAKLLEFGIDFETDIECVTTDGCAMMAMIIMVMIIMIGELTNRETVGSKKESAEEETGGVNRQSGDIGGTRRSEKLARPEQLLARKNLLVADIVDI